MVCQRMMAFVQAVTQESYQEKNSNTWPAYQLEKWAIVKVGVRINNLIRSRHLKTHRKIPCQFCDTVERQLSERKLSETPIIQARI